MKVISHRLIGNDVRFVQAKSWTKRSIQHKYLVMHFTAGRSFSKSLNTLTTQKVSAHLLVGREGEIAQMVDFNYKAWHAGASSWKGFGGINAYSIGIEMDNAGKLTKIGDSKWKTWFGKLITDEADVYEDVYGKFWHSYTKKQLEKIWDITKLLHEEYNFEEVLNHSDIAPARKTDAGPAFPMKKLREHLGL